MRCEQKRLLDSYQLQANFLPSTRLTAVQFVRQMGAGGWVGGALAVTERLRVNCKQSQGHVTGAEVTTQ